MKEKPGFGKEKPDDALTPPTKPSDILYVARNKKVKK